VEDRVAPCVPFIVNPIVLLEGKYKPVLKLPWKFSEGTEEEPTFKVNVPELAVLLVVL
jgi:hypothetical protein